MKDETRVLKSALPLYLEGTNGKAVLIIHGYNGYPGEMYELGRRINAEGYTVALPRLPGHGTNGADFRKTNHRVWLDYITNEYMNLKSRFESVTITGLSMGGVLSLLLAERFRPEKIILLAPAMSIGNKVFYLSPIIKLFIRKIGRPWEPAPSDDEDRIFMGKEYWSNLLTSNIASLLTLMRKAGKRLSLIECPVYCMLSETDELVALDAGDIIEKGVKSPFTKIILKNSPHVLVEGEEKETVFEYVTEWLKEEK